MFLLDRTDSAASVQEPVVYSDLRESQSQIEFGDQGEVFTSSYHLLLGMFLIR